jgi:hypothetical protein
VVGMAGVVVLAVIKTAGGVQTQRNQYTMM